MNEDTLQFAQDSVAFLVNEFRGRRQIILDQAGVIAHERKPDNTPVTELDKQIESEIISSFTKRFPDSVISGEETGYDPNNLPETVWLIDPIDGTSSFISNQPSFTCMAVLVHTQKAVAGVIYNPSDDSAYTAILGLGTTRNNQPTMLGEITPQPIGRCKGRFVESLNTIMKAAGITHETGSSGAGSGYAALLNGDIGVLYKLLSGGHIHDYAVGGLLISEAGGTIVPLLDDTYTYRTRSFVAVHPKYEQAVFKNIEAIRRLENPAMTAL